MFTYKDVDNLFLYTFRIDKDDFKNYFKLVNNNHNDMFGIVKNNFSRFWYYCTYEERIKWIELSNSNLEYYDNFNKLIKYVYEITVEEFDKKFYNGHYFDLDLQMITYKKNSDYENKDMLIMLKQNIVLFWLSLTDDKKEKLINLVNEYNFIVKENKYSNLTDFFKYIDEQNELPKELISLNYSEKDIDFIDNLPRTLLYLNLDGNKIKKLKNLPDSLIFLNISYCGDIEIDRLPKNLQFLSIIGTTLSNYNILSDKIEVLECDEKALTKIKYYPTNLESLFCSDRFDYILTLPYGIKDTTDIKYKYIHY